MATRAQALYLIAEVEGRTAPPDRAKELLYEAGFAAEAAKDDLTAAQVWVKLVFHVGYRLREFEEAYRLSDQARAAITRIGGHPLLEAKRLRAHGVILWAQGKPDDALALLLPALEQIEEVLGPNDPDVAANIADVASALSGQGKLEEAVEYSLRALAIRKRVLGPHHPDLASSHNNLGSQLGRLGRFAEAREHAEQALKILERSVGPEHIHVAFTLETLGQCQRSMGELEAALASFRRATAIAENARAPDHPDVAYSLIGQGATLRELGRLDESEKQLTRALMLLPENGDPRPAIEAKREQAQVWALRGERRRAMQQMKAVRDALGELDDEAGAEEVEAWIAQN